MEFTVRLNESNICLNDELGSMGSICELLTYNPDNLCSVCNEFMERYCHLPDILKRQGINDDDVSWFLEYVNWNK